MREEGLAKFGGVSIEGVCFESESPREEVGAFAGVDGGFVRHIDGFGDGPGDEGLYGSHHLDMALDGQCACSCAAASVCTIEDGQVFLSHVGCAFKGHGAADKGIEIVDLSFCESEGFEQVCGGIFYVFVAEFEYIFAEGGAEISGRESKLDMEEVWQRGFDFVEFFLRESFFCECFSIDFRSVLEGVVSEDVERDIFDLIFVVAEFFEGDGHGGVDESESPATCEFFVFDEGEVWFESGGVAVHDESDGSCGCDDADLCISESIFLTICECEVPSFFSGVGELGIL